MPNDTNAARSYDFDASNYLKFPLEHLHQMRL